MYSVQIETSDGTLSVINLGIEYFEKNDVSLYRNDTDTPLVLGTDWQWASDTSITLLKGVEPSGNRIIVIRTTDKDRAFNIYDGNAPFSRETLDENFRQMVYLAQEFTEGSGVSGIYRSLNMHGNRIINLGNPIDSADATTKGYVDTADNEQKDRIASLENTVDTHTVSYPWYTITSNTTDTLVPPLAFTKASVYINGVCQTPEYSYVVVSNTIMLADPVPAGTMVFARLGEDTDSTTGYATTTQLAAVASHLEATKAAGANADITSLSGLTTPISTVQGGTGNTAGRAAAATKLDVPRGIRTNLSSSSAVNFDGTSDVLPGVVGTLPIINGGTGATTSTLARTNLGAAASGVNTDINSITGLSGGIVGIITGVAPATGVVGEVLTAVSASSTNLTSTTAVNLITLTLTAGEWEVSDTVQITNSSNVTALTFGTSTTTGVLPANWYERYGITTTIAAGTSVRQGAVRRLRVSTSTTLYLVCTSTFTGTNTALGYIRAQRVR